MGGPSVTILAQAFLGLGGLWVSRSVARLAAMDEMQWLADALRAARASGAVGRELRRLQWQALEWSHGAVAIPMGSNKFESIELVARRCWWLGPRWPGVPSAVWPSSGELFAVLEPEASTSGLARWCDAVTCWPTRTWPSWPTSVCCSGFARGFVLGWVFRPRVHERLRPHRRPEDLVLRHLF
jgi:hypothetical protein